MKHYLFQGTTWAALLFFSLLTVACSPKHYTQTRENSVSLFYEHSNVNEVIFASSIDQYKPHPAKIVKDNVWEVTVPIEEEFSYFFIVDGQVTVPDCQLTVMDDFGSKNCLFVSGM